MADITQMFGKVSTRIIAGCAYQIFYILLFGDHSYIVLYKEIIQAKVVKMLYTELCNYSQVYLSINLLRKFIAEDQGKYETAFWR